MNPLALALKAIQSQMTGGPHRPTVPGFNDPEAALGMDVQYGHPLKVMGNGVDVSMFNDDPAAQNQMKATAGQKLHQRVRDITTKALEKAAQKRQENEKEYQSALKAYNEITIPGTVRPKGRTDSQKYIPAAIGLALRALGASHESVLGGASNYWNRVDQRNQQDADLENEQARQALALEMQKRGMMLREAGDARSRAMQDESSLQGKLLDSEIDVAGKIFGSEEATKRAEINAGAKVDVATLNSVFGDAEGAARFMSNANSQAIANGLPPVYSQDDFKRLPLAKQFKEAAQADEAKANERYKLASADQIEKMTPIKVKIGNADFELKGAQRDWVKTKIAGYPAYLEALAQRSAQGWANVKYKYDALGALEGFRDKTLQAKAFNSLLSSAKTQFKILGDQIKEAEKKVVPGDIVGAQLLDLLRQQRASLADQIMSGDFSEMGEGNAPVDPFQADPTLQGRIANPYK